MESLIPPTTMKLRLLLTGSLLLLTASFAGAQNIQPPEDSNGTQIAWASEAFAINLLADGITTFEDSGYDIRFELGTFKAGFDPLTATPEQWLSNWIVLQGADYDLVDQQFIQTATLNHNTEPFVAGTQAFIWGYNTKDLTMGAEWLIVGASSWTWPSSSAPLPTTFSMSDATSADVLVGNVNGSGFHMQLGAVTAVPEPSTSLLAVFTVTVLALRRKR